MKRWILPALALRLLVMPLSMHSDLLFIQYFPYFLSYKGVWDIYGYFGNHYLQSGFTYYPPLLYYLTAFFQWAFAPLNPAFPGFMEKAHEFFYSQSAASIPAYFEGLSRAETFRLIFLMKAPYLFADIGCWLLIANVFVGNGRAREKAMGAWFADPVLFYGIYLFGQYRMWTAFFCWLTIFFFVKGKAPAACFVLGLLCVLESAFLLLLPAVLLLSPSWKRRFGYAACAAVPAAAMLLPLAMHSNGLVLKAYYSPTVLKAATQSIFLSHEKIVGVACKAALLLGWTFMVRIAFRRSPAAFSGSRQVRFAAWSMIAFLMLYATSTAHVHYFIWGLPFLVFLKAEDGFPIGPRVWALVALLFIFNLTDVASVAGLFFPAFGKIFGERWVFFGKMVAVSRLAFSILCLHLAYLLYRRHFAVRAAV